jgi:hypothetical protein
MEHRVSGGGAVLDAERAEGRIRWPGESGSSKRGILFSGSRASPLLLDATFPQSQVHWPGRNRLHLHCRQLVDLWAI